MYPITQHYIEKFLQENIYSGVVYQFVKQQQREAHTLGFAQTVPNRVPLQSSMLFDVASLTKVVCTNTVILKLLEKEIINLDDSLKKYLPAFQNPEITLRHLLTHTSDIQTYIPNRNLLNQIELRLAYYGLQPGSQLGKRVQYTDAGTILVGFMLEEIYQKAATEIFVEEVLQPLKMESSQFLPEDNSDIVPTEKTAELGVLKGITHDPKARILAEHAGNAGLFSNLPDLQKFADMLLCRGEVDGKVFLRERTVIDLLKDQTPNRQGKRSLGWNFKFVSANQHPLLFHTGYTGTFMLLDVINHSSFIFLSNRVHPIDRRETYIEKRNEIIKSYLKESVLTKNS